jgi:catechol 2,3-dioxygenase-like lactoylglutathione lyase family enzyme
MKLEVVTLPVSDVDRAKRFYQSLGWRLDADIVIGEFRGVQFTPPRSPCSISFGKGLTSATPGSAQRLELVVSDIDAAREDLISRGVEVSELFHRDESGLAPGPDPQRRSYFTMRPSAIQMATAGCSKKSRSGSQAGSGRTDLQSRPRVHPGCACACQGDTDLRTRFHDARRLRAGGLSRPFLRRGCALRCLPGFALGATPFHCQPEGSPRARPQDPGARPVPPLSRGLDQTLVRSSRAREVIDVMLARIPATAIGTTCSTCHSPSSCLSTAAVDRDLVALGNGTDLLHN